MLALIGIGPRELMLMPFVVVAIAAGYGGYRLLMALIRALESRDDERDRGANGDRRILAGVVGCAFLIALVPFVLFVTIIIGFVVNP